MRWAGGNYAKTFASFPVGRESMVLDVVNPRSVQCEVCKAIRGQRCSQTAPGVEYHRVRWIDALVADR